MALWVMSLILLGMALCAWAFSSRRMRSIVGTPATKTPSKTESIESKVIPDQQAKWAETEPLKFRPFKPIYHITMALQSGVPSDLIVMDWNYKERVEQRRSIISDHQDTVTGAVPEGIPAARELYLYLLADYLPSRYPDMFTLDPAMGNFHNCVTGRTFPTTPPKDPAELFRILGETVEDDLFLLIETTEGHRMVSFVCCHPAGFDPSSKLGKVLKDVHEPVPSYDKIGPSIERFLARLEVGKVVKRLNWSVTTHTDLFSPSGNHVYSGDQVEEDEEVDIEKTRLRIEFQAVSRLPETKAILFSFKSYLYPVKEVKEEGLGPQFAAAIEGLKLGNAPGMWVYKGSVRWGKSVCEYLRS